MAAGAAKATNEELIERLKAAGEGTPEAAAIMGELWGQNIRLVRLTVHRETGLNRGEPGFEDMEQQAYFGFHYEAALTSMGLPPSAIAGTLAALRKLETASLDAEAYGSEDGDSVSLLDKLADGADIEADVIERVWQKELHAALMSALQDVPEDTAAVIVRHYFHGISMARIASEKSLTRTALQERKAAAFQTIRAGRYGAELAEFMPSMSKKERADRLIREDRAAVARLQLSDTEKELLAL